MTTREYLVRERERKEQKRKQRKSRRIRRMPEVEALTGLSRSTIYEGIVAGTFPAPVPLGARSVGWLESEIEDWIDARVAARDAGTAVRSLPPLLLRQQAERERRRPERPPRPIITQRPIRRRVRGAVTCTGRSASYVRRRSRRWQQKEM